MSKLNPGAFQCAYYPIPLLGMKAVSLSLNRLWSPSKHLLFWVAYFSFHVIYLGSALENGYELAIYQMCVSVVFHIAAVYINWLYLLPKYLNNNRFVPYFLLLVVCVLVLNLTMQTLLNNFVYAGLCKYSYVPDALFNSKRTIPQLITFFSLIGVTTAIATFGQQRKKEKFVQEVEKQNITNELNYLKSQMQPHFFFNTLNSLYALSLKKSDLAPEVILKLSDLMSYVIYETRSKEVLLSREVKHIQDVLELEKLRHGGDLEFEIEINGEDKGYKVPPLLFIPLVENAVKHGGKNNNGVIKICMEFDLTGSMLQFKIVNSLNKKNKITYKNGGVGVENLERRLQLIFNDNHQLITAVNEEEYTVTLEIPLI